MTMRKTAVALTLVVSFGGAAGAVELFTPPVGGSASGLYRCRILNVSNGEVTVNAQVLGTGGAIIDASGDTVLGPLKDVQAVAIPSENPFFCRFIVQGSRKKVRANLELSDPANGPTVVSAE